MGTRPICGYQLMYLLKRENSGILLNKPIHQKYKYKLLNILNNNMQGKLGVKCKKISPILTTVTIYELIRDDVWFSY